MTPFILQLTHIFLLICTEHLQVEWHEAITARKIDRRDLALPSKTDHLLGKVRHSGEGLQKYGKWSKCQNAKLNKIHKIMSPFFVPDLRRKSFQFFTTEYNIDCEFFIYSQIISVHNSLEKFYHGKYWILSNAFFFFFFFASIEKIVPFFLHSVNVVYPCIPGINPT